MVGGGAHVPLVSVVIATRDRPLMLADAVRSADQQDHPAVEIIVADDGSEPPASPPATARPMTVVRLGPAGRSAARNAGVRAASGRLIAFLDDDDTWVTGHLSALVSAWESSGASIVESGHEGWCDGTLRYRYLPLPDRPAGKAAREPRLLPSAVLIDRQRFDAVGGFDVTLDAHEDWDLWLRMGVDDVAVVQDATVRRAIRDVGPPPAERWRLHRMMLPRVLAATRHLPMRRRLAVRGWLVRTTVVRAAELAASVLGATGVWARLRARREGPRRRAGQAPIVRW